MTRRLGLRARITLFVTVVFAAATTVIGFVIVDRIEDGLVADTRSSAETVLAGYLESINGGVATVGVVDEQVGTTFFYRDDAGAILTEAEYFSLITGGLDEFFADLTNEVVVANGEPFAEGFVAQQGVLPLEGAFGPVAVEPDTGVLLDESGTAITFVQGPLIVGQPEPVDLGDDVVAVAQQLEFPDGAVIEVGVSSPLRPVTDSIDALRNLLWFAIPALVLTIGAVTWLSASRALRPVHRVSAEAGIISAERLHDRLPVPEANDELRELVETVNEMLARLQQAQSRQRQLVADASHELRSPVAASRAQLEVAAGSPDATDWERTASTVLAEQERLSDLIDDLLALSRLDETGLITPERLDLAHVVAEEARRPRTPSPTVAVRSGLDAAVMGDAKLLDRAIGNLLDNAVRHAASAVAVSVCRTTEGVVVHVDDDGPGIPEADRDRVFERFTRLDEARDRDRGGTGLGLAIARDIARAHGGDVACEAATSGGARLTLSIPPAQP